MDATRAMLLSLVLSASMAQGAVLNLRSLGEVGNSFATVVDGIPVRLQASSGDLLSTATGFGIDQADMGGIANQIDGGSGTAEQLSLLFGRDVIVESVVISYFGASDRGIISIKGSGDFPLHDGLNEFSGVIARRTSANYISWTGSTISDPDLGFSVDTITFRAVPEAQFGLLSVPCLVLMFLGRRVAAAGGARGERS